jgi:hypothetical protein
MESVIFNYLRESLKLEKHNGVVCLLLRNPDGKWIEISNVLINSEHFFGPQIDNVFHNRYLSNDD